jgi:hypothetical protein
MVTLQSTRREQVHADGRQVLFKRKPVQYLPQPSIEDDNSEVRILQSMPKVLRMALKMTRSGSYQRLPRSLQIMKPTYNGEPCCSPISIVRSTNCHRMDFYKQVSSPQYHRSGH